MVKKSGPLAFLNKKTWHPGRIQNQEEVWKREQEAAREQQRLKDLQKQIAEERARDEMDALAEAAGIKKRSEKLDWMYQGGVAARQDADQRTVAAETAATAPTEPPTTAPAATTAAPPQAQAPPAQSLPAFYSEDTPASAREMWQRLHSDPLFAIKQQEMALRQRALAAKQMHAVSGPRAQTASRFASERDAEIARDRKQGRIRSRSRDEGERSTRERRKKRKEEKKSKKTRRRRSDRKERRRGSRSPSRSYSSSPSRSDAASADSKSPSRGRNSKRRRKSYSEQERGFGQEKSRRSYRSRSRSVSSSPSPRRERRRYDGHEDRSRSRSQSVERRRRSHRPPDRRRSPRAPIAARRDRNDDFDHHDREGGRGGRGHAHAHAHAHYERGTKRYDSSRRDRDYYNHDSRSRNRDDHRTVVRSERQEGDLKKPRDDERRGNAGGAFHVDGAAAQGTGTAYGITYASAAPEEVRQQERRRDAADATQRRLEEAARFCEKEARDAEKLAKEMKQRRLEGYKPGKLSEEERTKRLAEMSAAAQDHEAFRHARVTEHEKKEMAEEEAHRAGSGGQGGGDTATFLQATTKEMYGAALAHSNGVGGDDNEGGRLGAAVGRRRAFVQRGGDGGNAFRK